MTRRSTPSSSRRRHPRTWTCSSGPCAPGKAVLCEKPIDLDITRVDACRAAIGALADVQAGEIGTLEQLTIVSRDPSAAACGVRHHHQAGLFRDMTIHDFDMARFFLGDVVEVGASGSNLVSSEIAEAGDIDGAVVGLRGAGGDAANESLRTGAAVKVGQDCAARTGRWWPSPRRRCRRR